MNILGIKFAPLNIPLKRRLQTLACLYYFSEFFILPFIYFYIFYKLLFTKFYFLTLIYFAFILWDLKTPETGGRKLQWFKNLTIWKYVTEYFPLKTVVASDLPEDRNYIFGVHPHGIASCSCTLAFLYGQSEFNQKYKNFNTSLLTLDNQFYIPIHREVGLSLGICSANKNSINHILSKQGNNNIVVLVVGGALEALDAIPNKIKLYLNKRKGFIKLALINGASLVPVFQFGENELFNQIEFNEKSIFKKLQKKFTELIKFSPPLFHGRGIFQYNYGFLPFRRPLTVVVGKPIDVIKNDCPTEKDINDLHEKYIQSLINLYEEYNPIYGNKDTVLRIY